MIVFKRLGLRHYQLVDDELPQRTIKTNNAPPWDTATGGSIMGSIMKVVNQYKANVSGWSADGKKDLGMFDTKEEAKQAIIDNFVKVGE